MLEYGPPSEDPVRLQDAPDGTSSTLNPSSRKIILPSIEPGKTEHTEPATKVSDPPRGGEIELAEHAPPHGGAPERPEHATEVNDSPRGGAPERPEHATEVNDSPRGGAPERPEHATEVNAPPRGGEPERAALPLGGATNNLRGGPGIVLGSAQTS